MHRSINELRVEVDPSSRFRAPVSRTLAWVGDRLSDVVVGIRPIRFSARGWSLRGLQLIHNVRNGIFKVNRGLLHSFVQLVQRKTRRYVREIPAGHG